MALGAVLLAAGGANAAFAVDLTPGFSADTTWTDEVFPGSRFGTSDTTIRITPRLAVEDHDGTFTWKLSAAPDYEYYVDIANLRGWDHDVQGEGTWNVTKATTLRFSERFQRYRSIQRINEVAGETLAPEEIGNRLVFFRNTATASLVHSFDGRNQVSLQASHFLWDFSDQNRTDFEVVSATLGYSYLYSRRSRVGVSASWRNRALERKSGNSAFDFQQDTDFYTVSLTLNHMFDRNWSLEGVAGPALVGGAGGFTPPSAIVSSNLQFQQGPDGNVRVVDFASCPTLPDGRVYFDAGACSFLDPPLIPDANGNLSLSRGVFPFSGPVPPAAGSTITAFVDMTLSRVFPEGKATLSVRREEDSSTATSSSGVSNRVALQGVYRPSPRWFFTVRVSYSLREQLVEQVVTVPTLTGPISICRVATLSCPAGLLLPGTARTIGAGATELSRDDQTRTYLANFSASYRWDRRTRIRFSMYWTDEERTRGSATVRSYDRFTAWMGITYEFDPIRLHL